MDLYQDYVCRCPTCTEEQERDGQLAAGAPYAFAHAQGLKPSNPKDDVGITKPPLSLWPAVATLAGSLAMHDGRLKYGKANFRAIGVRVSVYLDAAKRHLDKYNEGQWADPETGVPHLGYAMACCAIILESHYAKNLTDDRPIGGGYMTALEELAPVVKALSELRKDLHPKHYTRDQEDQ